MAVEGSVTIWLDELKQGDQQAAQQLWQRYWHQLIRLANKKLGRSAGRVADAEDVAICAIDSFYRGAQEGRFPKLEDRDDLWQLLVMITARKAVNQIKYETRLKRGGGQVRGESVFAGTDNDSQPAGIDQVTGGEPTPEFAAAVAEEYERRLEQLKSESLRNVARLKLEGHTVDEIAEQLDCSSRTIKRKLALIKTRWSEEQKS
ncbi:MAG: ECF-type sigma factor, partial [Planctomycetales bacterium]